MRSSFFLYFFLIVATIVPAQTAEVLEEILNTDVLTYEQAISFTLEAADIWDFSDGYIVPSHNESYRLALAQGWIPIRTRQNDNARLDVVSLLLMRSFGIEGGFMYNLFKSPHYAYRELVYKGILQGQADPQMTVSGDMLLFLINRMLSYIEGFDWRPVLSVKPEIQILAEQIMEEIDNIPDTSVTVTQDSVTISIPNIQFLPDSWELPESVKPELEEIAHILSHIPQRRIHITGHTAMAGTAAGRDEISLGRAQAVKDYLVSLGVRTADEISVQGMGGEDPAADNSTPEGMALNRRIEITILEN